MPTLLDRKTWVCMRNRRSTMNRKVIIEQLDEGYLCTVEGAVTRTKACNKFKEVQEFIELYIKKD